MAPDIDFKAIRAFDGSQNKAFEELCYQLLRPTLPRHVRLERPGAPDAGVDLIVWLGDGSAHTGSRSSSRTRSTAARSPR